MNTLRLSVLTTVMAFGLGGCAQHGKKFGAGLSLSPGVIVTNPISQPGGLSNGFLTVVWTPSQAALNGQANWSIGAVSRPISTSSFVMLSGNATVNFGALAGYTPPPSQLIHVWKGQTTTVTVTYGHP